MLDSVSVFTFSENKLSSWLHTGCLNLTKPGLLWKRLQHYQGLSFTGSVTSYWMANFDTVLASCAKIKSFGLHLTAAFFECK